MATVEEAVDSVLVDNFSDWPEPSQTESDLKAWRLSEAIKHRISLNKNALLMGVGDTGSGKSYSMCRILHDCDPTFGLHRIVYSLEEMIDLMESGQLTKGQALLYDEIGVTQPNDEWYTVSSKAFNFEFQTNRQDNFVVGFAAPDFSFVNKKTKKLFHYLLEAQHIDFGNNIAVFKVKELQTNHVTGKQYFHFPIDDRGYKIAAIECKKPPASFCNAYEEKKRIFRSGLRKEIKADLQSLRVKGDSKIVFNPEKAVLEILKNPSSFELVFKGRKLLDVSTIMTYFKVGESKAMRIKKEAESRLYGQGKPYNIN